MKFPARAVTNSSGRMTMMDQPHDVFHVDTTMSERVNPWAIEATVEKAGTISTLLSIDKYNLLARFLMGENYPLDAKCIYCDRPGYLKEIKLRGKVFRLFRGKVYIK